MTSSFDMTYIKGAIAGIKMLADIRGSIAVSDGRQIWQVYTDTEEQLYDLLRKSFQDRHAKGPTPDTFDMLQAVVCVSGGGVSNSQLSCELESERTTWTLSQPLPA